MKQTNTIIFQPEDQDLLTIDFTQQAKGPTIDEER